MKLWTWQTDGFDIRTDHVDLGMSRYYGSVDGIREKYARVTAKLGTADLIWCFTVATGWKSNQTPENNRVCWELEVPADKIACFVDEWLADRLQQNKPCPDIATWRCWSREAVQQHPKRQDRQEHFVCEKMSLYDAAPLTLDEGWRGFFLDADYAAEHVTAILICPIDRIWVVKCGPTARLARRRRRR